MSPEQMPVIFEGLVIVLTDRSGHKEARWPPRVARYGGQRGRTGSGGTGGHPSVEPEASAVLQNDLLRGDRNLRTIGYGQGLIASRFRVDESLYAPEELDG